MKKIILWCLFFPCICSALAQEKLIDGSLQKSALQKIYINENVSLHFISPEPIQYADISTKRMLGDLPVKNILRLKYLGDKDSLTKKNMTIDRNLGVVTVVGEKFIAQYDLWYTYNINEVQTQIEILPAHSNSLNVGSTLLTQNQLHDFSLKALENKMGTAIERSSAMGLQAQVNNIYTVDDYAFIDITYSNSTKLKYDIEGIRFKIEDKRIVKATNVQSIEIKPIYQLYNEPSFNHKYRNIFVFKKFTFPDNKKFTIEMTEKQISGRTIVLKLNYSDLLKPDSL